jgi:hypothetical protein
MISTPPIHIQDAHENENLLSKLITNMGSSVVSESHTKIHDEDSHLNSEEKNHLGTQ